MQIAPLASGFLTGSIISLAIPAGVLIVVVVWYALELRQREER